MANLVSIQFPDKIPNVDANSRDFESGFDETSMKSGFASNYFMCSICEGFPRRPITLKKCGHLFCELCIKDHFDHNSKVAAPFMTLRNATCPSCTTRFMLGDIKLFEEFDLWAQGVYKCTILNCPYGCGFTGNAFEVDKHQVYTCRRRKIACPNEGCGHVLPACDMEALHFSTCPNLRVFCHECKLPVLLLELSTHNCLRRMHTAMDGIFNSLSYFASYLLITSYILKNIPNHYCYLGLFLELCRALTTGSSTIPPLCMRGTPGTVFVSPLKRLMRKRLFGDDDEDEGLPNRRDDVTDDGAASTVALTGNESTH